MEKKFDGQTLLETHVEKTLIENNVDQKDLINGMMKSEGAGCSYENKTLSFAYPAQSWQMNRGGMLHGGIIALAFDQTMAALARFFAHEDYAPTISLDIKFIRPIIKGDTMIVTAKATGTGTRISQITCEAVSKNTGKLVATGASVNLNVDTTKQG